MEALSCKTAQVCEKEMWVYFLAYNLIRLLMTEAALQANVLPRERTENKIKWDLHWHSLLAGKDTHPTPN